MSFNLSQEELSKIKILRPMSKKQEQYLQDTDNQIIVFGGASASGKTYISSLKLFFSCVAYPETNAYMLRESGVQLKSPGSVWGTFKKLSNSFPSTSVNNNELAVNFKSSESYVRAHWLDNNRDDFQGSQLSLAVVDEATMIPDADDILYILSRLRGGSKNLARQLLLTCNPDKNHFLCDWLVRAGYVDGGTGLPNPDMDAVTTYMISYKGVQEFYKSREEVKELHGEDLSLAARKFVFYSGTINDNPEYMINDKDYYYSLLSMNEQDKQRYLYGNWFLSGENEGFIDRDSFEIIDKKHVPKGLQQVRAWDFGYTKPDPTSKEKHKYDPDYTYGLKGVWDDDTQILYITGKERLRDDSAMVKRHVLQTAQRDGRDTIQIIPMDGAAGKSVYQEYQKALNRLSINCKSETVRKSKIDRAKPWILAAQEGRIKIVDGVFDPLDWEQIERFTGEKKSKCHDDAPDTISSLYNTFFNNRVTRIKIDRNNNRLNSLTGKTLLC